MPETSPDNLGHEHEQEHRFEESAGSSPRAGSRVPEAAHSDTLHTEEEQEAATSPQQLREAVFAKADPSSADPSSVNASSAHAAATEAERQREPEPVSLWEKIKHSAFYGNKQKAAAAAASSDRGARRQNKTGLLLGGVLTVLVAGVWLLYLVSSPVRRPPAQDTTTAAQQPAAKSEKSLTPGLQAHPSEQQSSGEQAVTAADVRGTSNGTTPRSPAAQKSGTANANPDYELGKIPPPPAVAAPPVPPVSNQKNPLDTTSLVFVRHLVKDSPGTTAGAGEAVSLRPAMALQSQEFEDLPTGTRLIARLETPVSTAVALPAVATVEYNYEDKDHTLLIPAGSRVLGKLEQADAQGFVGLHFQSIQRPSDSAPIPFEARAIGLNFQPLKGVVSGRNTTRRFLVRAASGIGEMTAATVGMSRGAGSTDALNNNVLIRQQLMNNVGSASDQELQQLAYSEHRVITLAGNTRFYLVIDHETKQWDRRDRSSQPVPDANASNASMQAQLVELRKELADVTAKQTTLGPSQTALGAGQTTQGTGPTSAEILNPASPSEETTPTSPPQ